MIDRALPTAERLESEIWAEWFTLGLADIGVFSDWYFSHASAFAMSAFAYNLKPHWYSGTTCMKLLLPDSGALASNDELCRNYVGALPQHHLNILGSHGSFPASWAGNNGKIYVNQKYTRAVWRQRKFKSMIGDLR